MAIVLLLLLALAVAVAGFLMRAQWLREPVGGQEFQTTLEAGRLRWMFQQAACTGGWRLTTADPTANPLVARDGLADRQALTLLLDEPTTAGRITGRIAVQQFTAWPYGLRWRLNRFQRRLVIDDPSAQLTPLPGSTEGIEAARLVAALEGSGVAWKVIRFGVGALVVFVLATSLMRASTPEFRAKCFAQRLGMPLGTTDTLLCALTS